MLEYFKEKQELQEKVLATMVCCVVNNQKIQDQLLGYRLNVYLNYDLKTWSLNIAVKEGHAFMIKDKSNMYWKVEMTLQPFQKYKFTTKFKKSLTPHFSEVFKIKRLPLFALPQLSVRYRVYARQGRIGCKTLVGEADVELTYITDLEGCILQEWREVKRNNGRKRADAETLV